MLLRLFTASLVMLFAACSDSGFRSAAEWNGIALTSVLHEELPPDLRAAVTEFPPKRMLQTAGRVGGAVVLSEFSGPVAAYLVFQELSTTHEDFSAGFTVRGDRVSFVRGRWVGSVPLADWPGPDGLATSLSLPPRRGEEGHVPGAFASMLHQGRYAGSERVLVREFLGHSLDFPVFAVLLDCHGDPAWVYATARASDTLRAHARHIAAGEPSGEGGRRGLGGPLVVHVSGRGMVVVEGCFDENLTRSWIEMQSRALKRLKMRGGSEIFRNFD